MTLTTSRGETFEVNWAWASARTGQMLAELAQDMDCEAIAKAFDRCEHFKTNDKIGGSKEFNGYVRLVSIVRETSDHTVQLIWDKGDAP